MKYQKQPLSIAEQIAKLEGRGLLFKDKNLAAKYLSNISYYRLRAYTYPFQDNDDPNMDHQFIREDITFQDIIDLYVFDRRLRSLVFNELEKWLRYNIACIGLMRKDADPNQEIEAILQHNPHGLCFFL